MIFNLAVEMFQYMVRGLTDTAGEHGKTDEFFAGNASWAYVSKTY